MGEAGVQGLREPQALCHRLGQRSRPGPQQRAQHLVEQRGALRGGQPNPDPPQQLTEEGHGVGSQGRHGCVPGLAERGDPHRLGALLAYRQRDQDPSVDELQPLATSLVDGEVGPEVRSSFEQPPHPDIGLAVLLVGDHQEPQITARTEAGAGELGHGHAAGRHLVLHVDRSPAEKPAVLDDGVEGRMPPVARVGRHHVEVADERQ